MNIFKQFYKSLYSPKDIASFRSQGIGKTIVYVFLLSLLSALPTIYFFNASMTDGLQAVKATIIEDIPSFTIENGELQSPESEPLTINKGTFSIIFDSTGSIDKQNVSNSGDTLALLKREVVLTSGGEVNSFPYSMMGLESVTKQEIKAFLEGSDSAMAVLLPILSIVIFLFNSALKFIEISILALIGLLLSHYSKRKLAYRELWRMTAYSVTLPVVFFTIMTLVQTHVPFGSLIYWFVSLIVLLLAIQEASPNEPHSLDQNNH